MLIVQPVQRAPIPPQAIPPALRAQPTITQAARPVRPVCLAPRFFQPPTVSISPVVAEQASVRYSNARIHHEMH